MPFLDRMKRKRRLDGVVISTCGEIYIYEGFMILLFGQSLAQLFPNFKGYVSIELRNIPLI